MPIKSINLLPEIFRSESNRKFLAATMDQLVSEPDPTVRLDSYIGRTDAPTWKSGDTYVTEPTTERQNYQLEASTIVDAGQGQTDFYANYQDLLHQIEFYGGFTNDHSRLFTNQSYSFDGVFDFDKFVNFTQYVWLPNGPPQVTVSASAVDVGLEYNVNRSTGTQSYQFTEFGSDKNPIITLVKGTTYQFRINQPGHKFWIQTQPGITGSESEQAEVLKRQIYGLQNNGIEAGTIEFNVPLSNAQGTIASAKLAATVDFATMLKYNQIQSHLANIVKDLGGFDGVSQGLNGKTVIFLNEDVENDTWTDPGNFDGAITNSTPGTFDYDLEGFEYGLMVPGTKRYGVFQIRTVDAGGGRQIIKLDQIQDIEIGDKVYVRAGQDYANVNFIKAPNGRFQRIESVTAPLDTLYYQDDTESNFFGIIRLVEPGTEIIDVDADIVGRLNYTSPNQINFTNGLHVRFDNTVTPARYANNAYIVEGVGTGIKLVNTGNFHVPEQYANTDRLSIPDYVTVNRASRDRNAWSRSNRWFHIQTVELAAKYREDPTLLDLAGVARGKRPIIEFDADIYLFNYGRNAKSPVDILDFTITDAFKQVEGKSNYVVQMPNGVTRQLTPGTRIIFANDTDPQVRNKIYRVDEITTSTGTKLHLVSLNTQDTPIYSVSGARITSNLAYDFVPTVTFAPPLPGIGTRTALGNVILKTTGVDNFTVNYSGVSYIADPYLRINSDYTTAANINIVYRPFKQVDYIRIDTKGTAYTSTSTNIALSNPNQYWATVNSVVGTSGLTFEINAGNITNSVTTTILSTTVGNVDLTFSNIGLGYFQANVSATISAPTTPAGVAAVVNYVYLHANGAIKAVNLLSSGSGYVTPPTVTITGANTYPASVSSVSTTTGTSTTLWDYLVPGMQIVANGMIGGTIISAVDRGANLITISAPAVLANVLLDPPLVGISTSDVGDLWTFKANATAGTYATVANTAIDSTIIDVDSTDMLDVGMIVSGGVQPVAISSIVISSVPTRIITSDLHGLLSGDLVYLRGIVGTTELNFARFYVKRISDTALDLYTDPNLATGSEQDSRNYTDYVSGGTATSYTIDYGTTLVQRVIGPTQFETNRAVTIKAGSDLVFVGVKATAVARSDGNTIYNITVIEPGSGYETVPTVTIENSNGNPATATAVCNDLEINYIEVVDAGTGYQIQDLVTIDVVDSVDLTTVGVTTNGSNELIFSDSNLLTPIQPGWLVFLITTVNGEDIYTDFEQIPYATTETTGPSDIDYRFFMDVAKTQATILTVDHVDSDRLVLSGLVNSLDSDGEIIDLPAGSKIHVTSRNKFFTQDGRGSGALVTTNFKAGFIIQSEAIDTNALFLNSVLGIQPGMQIQTLGDTLTNNIKVKSVDAYIGKITLTNTVTLPVLTPVKFLTNANMDVKLGQAEIDYIDILDEGVGYSSAPVLTIEPRYSTVTQLATCLGTTTVVTYKSIVDKLTSEFYPANRVLKVTSFAGIPIGSKVTSNFDNLGVGITTGSNTPVVVGFAYEQTGSNTFEPRVILDIEQPAFTDLEAKFTLAAEALTTINLENSAIDVNDSTPETFDIDDTVLVNIPANETQTATNIIAYNQYYFDGAAWVPAQQKSNINQEPLFDAFDAKGSSAGDGTVYPGTKFVGTKIFGYRIGTGTQDPILRFPLVYKNFENVGDIEFSNYFQNDTFNYLDGFTETTVAISSFVLKQKTATGYRLKNIWSPVTEESKQFQSIIHVYDGTTNYFEVDILPAESKTIPYLKVYVGNKRLSEGTYQLTQYGGRTAIVVDLDQLVLDERVIIKIYSKQQSTIGQYETPINLDFNPLNNNFNFLTLGQIRNHLSVQADNHYGVIGKVLGSNNLRDLNIKNWQGSILQHASSMSLPSLFLIDKDLDVIHSIEFAQKEYTKFKNRFIDSASRVQINVKDIPASVDLIMESIMLGKSSMSPWYDSDMLPWGKKFRTVTTFPVLNTRQRTYLIPATFDPTVLSTRSVLVYLHDSVAKTKKQLIRDHDFSFVTDISSITISSALELNYNNTIEIVDTSNTVECYVPETPTKLGLYPKYVPHIYEDTTYRTPRRVLQGHDGSLTPTYGDYRDDLLLELELRIYNNIKVSYDDTLLEVYSAQPGRFRATDYSKKEFDQLLTRSFLAWIGSNKLDYSTNQWFSGNDPWTWNYSSFTDRQGSSLPGFWRSIYKYYYDTDRPNTHPWEMLGFGQQPNWWISTYGPGPYTSGNKVLWEDLEVGLIADGVRAGIDARFARPGLAKIIPVDDTGNLIPPIQILVNNFNGEETARPFAIGDQGPVETAWRRSSDYAFAVQIALTLARPAFYLGTFFDNSRYNFDRSLGQIVYSTTRQRFTPESVLIPNNGLSGADVVLTAGYANWVRDYLTYKGIDGSAKIQDYLKKLNIRLSYRVAGFTDKRMLEVIAEQSSPAGSGRNIVIPDENYRVYLNKSAPVKRLVYSAVIVERTTRGWKVSGYDTNRPYFYIIPSEVNNNAYTLTELNQTVAVYRDYQLIKLTVPYGTEFTSYQTLADFLNSYSRYLQATGFVFNEVDPDLNIVRDWDLGTREFLTWAQQGWSEGSILIISPIGSKVTLVSNEGVIDYISNKSDGNRLLDQNFSLIRTGEYTVTRDSGVFTANALYNKMIALADFTLVNYEHVLIFDNNTVFNDTVYQPELGNRQYRLRLIGFKSGDWNGQLNAPGYIYNDQNVDEWIPNASYSLGSLVDYKNQYYMALQRVPESSNFDFTYWRPITDNKIKTGLLPNLSHNAGKFKLYYDTDQVDVDENSKQYSNGLIGFRNRSFLQDLGVDTRAQVKFYQGYIKQKGTRNAITSLAAGQFDRVTSEIDFYEEWALRVGEYGATGSDQYLELVLNEQQFTQDPSTVLLLDYDEPEVSGVINFNPRTIYRTSEETYSKNLIKARTDLTPRIGDNVVAGYPRLDDIDGTIYDIENYQDYYGLVSDLGAGYKLWVAVDTDKAWNVYRATETDILLTSITRVTSNRLLFTFDAPHGTFVNDLVVVKNFNNREFDGFYRVLTIEDGLSITVQGYRGLNVFQQVSSITGSGVYLRMINIRFNSVSEIIEFTPPHGWRNQDRVWIDNDQGIDKWGVYQKTDGWNFDKILPLRLGEDRYQEGYGSEVRLSVDNVLALAGTPGYTFGSLLGLRVINPGVGYDSPSIRISFPTGATGQLAQFSALKDNGTLILANLITQGSGYTFAPNVTLTDEWNTVTTADSASNFLYIPVSAETHIYTGDFIEGRGIPVGTQTAEAVDTNNHRVKVSVPTIPSFASATTVTVGLGTKTFTTAIDVTQTDIVVDQGVRIYKSGDNYTYMEGYVVSFVGTTLVVEVEVISGTGAAASWLVTTYLSVRSGANVRFYRGSAGGLATRLTPTNIDYIEVVDGGSGFVLTPLVDITGGGGSGARAVAVVSGGVIRSITLTNPGSGYYETPDVSLLTNNPVAVDLRARLKLTSVGSLIITDKGQDYREPAISIVTNSRDFASSATGTISFYGNGGVQSITVSNRGRSYGTGTTVTIANSTTGSGFVGTVSVFANGNVNTVSVTTPGSGYETAFATANIFYAGGSGATGNVGRTQDGIATFGPTQVISYGQGYLFPPTVEVIDQSGAGTGAVIEAILPTGQVKTFLRLSQNATALEETQLIKPFNNDAREFGYSIDVGTILAVIGSPGSYVEQGGALISQTLGSQWISYQMLFPPDLAEGDRFGHSVAMSDDQQWIYVGAPGGNKVYCYGRRSQAYNRVTITPIVNQATYSTNLVGLKSASELKVLGSTGKLYEANFDYAVDSQGSIYFADYDRIANQAKVYITRQRLQTTINPITIRGLLQRTYVLNSRPETIDQLLVYGATGRVFVPNKEYIVVGSNIVFLDDTFRSEPSIVANQRDIFYQLIETITPPDTINADANFGWSVKIDKGGYRVLVGAPDVDETDADLNTVPSAGRAYVFSRSYEVILSVGTQTVFTLNEVRPVLSASIDDVLLTESVDYIVTGNSVVFTKAPRNGAKIKIDTNFFNLIQTIPCPSQVNLGRFGYSVDISPDNKSFAVGSPGYRDENYYNGAVYRYVNKGAFYGTVTTERDFKQVALELGATIKVNDKLVTFSNIVPGLTQNVTAAYSTVTAEISLVSNVGLAIGDQIIGPDILTGFSAKITGWGDTSASPTYSNVQVNIPVTVTAGDSLQFIRGGDNLDKIKRNFESGGLVAVNTTITSDGYLQLAITGNYALKTIDILPGVGTALAGIGLKVYELTQVLQHPRYGVPERFGTRVAVDETGNTVLIASEGGNTLKTSTFDAGTTLFDMDTTRFIDSLNASGAVYVYDYLNPPGETLANPGKLLYNQVLQDAFILTGDNFGSSIDINRGWAIVGADRSDYHSFNAGTTHLFVNETNVKGWSRLRERGEEIDIDYINKAIIYDKTKQVSLQDLDYFDPAKGKILGLADQDLDYKSSYDPAQYNRGTRSSVTIATDSYWGEIQETQTWWDLSLSRYINYEQGPINYRSTRWGQLFPGSVVQVCEWVGSNYLPSQYAIEVGDGEAKYPDDSAYVETTYFDSQSGLIKTKYYYWVINKQGINTAKTKRTNSVVTIERLIENPQAQGIPYFAAIANNAFNIYNVKQYLNSDRTTFRVEYSRVLGDIISHNEYELIQQGSANSFIPTKLIDKMIDSLSGENSTGSVVPDLKLSEADAYGISNLPRQSMIKNNLSAAQVFVTFVNNKLSEKKITGLRDFARLLKQEPIPASGVGFYDSIVNSVEQLAYIPDTELFIGYKVLVRQDTEFYGYWTIYEYQQYVGFRMIRIQSYDTTRWWNYADWYATGVDEYTNINFTVSRYIDILRLDLVAGDTVKVQDSGKGTYTVYRMTDAGLEEIIVERGTIKLSTALYDPTQSRIGFDNSAFDQVGFSTTQALELRNIFEALAYDIFVDTDRNEVNNLFFTLLNYILSEQLTVDWAIKTSLISVLHKIRKLEQFPSYIKDNQTYYEDYINEVKPYRTQIREYLLDYQGLEELNAGMSDFDFPSVYDKGVGAYRTLNINDPVDLTLINSTSRRDWYNNYKYQIQDIVLTSGGAGYTSAPRVNLVGGGGTGATAQATVLNGSITRVDLLTSGTGYTSTPLVVFVGGNGSGASAAVALVQPLGTPVTSATLNKKIRSVLTKLRFDRISYTSTIRNWKPYEIYHPGDVIIVDDVRLTNFSNYTERLLPRFSFAYRVLKTLTGRATIDLNIFENPEIVQKLSGSDLDNANDRLAAYHNPGSPDSARIVSTPDTIRFVSSPINDQIISVAKQWNAVKHSVIYPSQHGYQYAAVGDASLIGLSKDGINWVTNRITDTTINGRDVFFYRDYTWVVVANRGTIYYTDDGETWTRESINTYRYDPSQDNPNGKIQENTAQTLDLTGGASASTTYSDYLLVAGNNGSILANPRGYSSLTTNFNGWYNVKVQNQVVVQNYLKMLSIDFGDLKDIDGTTYDVELQQVSGFFVESINAVKKRMKKGVVFTAGVNGAINAITFNALDDYMQGFIRGYSYTDGKEGVTSYPWKSYDVPVAVKGSGDGLSGEQINALAVTGTESNWVLAVGTGGTLLWNQFNFPLKVRDGRAELAPDTIGKVVVDYDFVMFKNFRKFDDDNFVAPLTRAQIETIDFNDATWDGEKFVVVGNRSTIIWGYPGVMPEAYIEIGTLDPSMAIASRRETASWSSGTAVTSRVISISATDLDAASVVLGMTCYSTGLPADAVVTQVVVGTSTHLITVSFASTNISAGTERGLKFAYVLSSNITANSTITATDGITTVSLNVSRLATKGDTRVYVDNYNEQVQSNWILNGTGIPTNARIKYVGKFASFSWQLAPGNQENVNLDYRAVTVNRNIVNISKPLLAVTGSNSGTYSGATITLSDDTGTIFQSSLTQLLPGNVSILTLANVGSVNIGYTIQANAILGIQDGTKIESLQNYIIGGVNSGLEKDIPDLIPGTGYTGSRVQGTRFTETLEDNLALDTIITSEFADDLIGQRPEDIIVDGGKFIDTYSSHAPEELVPGQVIDSLQMNVFTANVVNGQPDYGNVIAFKIFTDYKLPSTYYRLSSEYTTTLTSDLTNLDSEAYVADIAKLPDSGSIWVNAEKIVYLAVDRTAGTLKDLRRGALRTSVAPLHAAGSLITDATAGQIIASDYTTSITEDVTVENGIVGGSNTATYLSSAITSIKQGKIWLN